MGGPRVEPGRFECNGERIGGALVPIEKDETMCRPFTAVLLFVALLTAGCGGVAFYEKRALADPVMALDDGGAEAHFYSKIYYSREGSIGGIGASAGGGCGCY